MLKMPTKKSLSDKVGLYLFENGPSTMYELCDALQPLGHKNTSVRSAVRDMRFRDLLNLKDGQYSLGVALRMHYSPTEQKEQVAVVIAGPRYNPGFRPLSTKNMPHLAPRREPIREDFSCKVASSSVPFSWSW